MFFIFSAYAQEVSAVPASAGFDFRGLIPFVLVIGVMYLFIIRPQQKKMKQHQELISNIRRGDRVLTAGGLIGMVHKVVNNEEVLLELEGGMRVRLIKTAISQVLAKTEPLKTSDVLDPEEDLDVSMVPASLESSSVVKLNKKPAKNKPSTKL